MPGLDFAALWETHCRYEFDTRDVDATMATMVSVPYVNQVGLLDPKGLPVAGSETAHKVMDKAGPSNELMARWATSEGKPI